MRIDTDWNHYTYAYGDEGRTAVVHFDVGCALMPCPDSHQTTVRIQVRQTEAAHDLRAHLGAHLGPVDCWLVGTMAYADVTVLVLQVEALTAFDAALPAVLAGLDAAVERSPGWSFFEDRICPTEKDWRRITDREQLERLDVDPTVLADVAHSFYGSEKGLGAIHARLVPEGFRGEPAGDRLEMRKDHRPADVSGITLPLMRLARQHGCAYDGWRILLALLLAAFIAVPPAASAAPEPSMPLVIGHRGAPGHLPDHTLEGYRKAVALGADYIEPDLVPTKDGHLIARHDSELSLTTDVAAKFPERKRTALIDGETMQGWFSTDFTLAEIRTLRAVQPYPERPHDHDGQYLVPTFDEILALRATLAAESGRAIGVYPELKHPTYHQGLGHDMVPKLVDALTKAGLDQPDSPVIVQCFEPTALDRVAAALPAPRILLVGEPDALPADGGPSYGVLLADLPALRQRVHGLGVHKSAVLTDKGSTGLVPLAHAADLWVHVYTFRNEPRMLGPGADGDPIREVRAFFDLGVDGVFADFPDTAVAARAARPETP